MPRLRHRRKRLAVTLIAIGAVTASCTPQQIAMWQDWHAQDPAAAEAFAAQPEIQAELAAGQQPEADVAVGDGNWEAGNCASFADEAAAAGVPWGVFSPIAWRESGCNPGVWVVDSDDTGGGLVGFNFKGSLAGHWRDLCGATTSNIRNNVPLQMDCIHEQYSRYGLSAWRT